MQKTYTGRYVNIPLLVQEINNMFLSEGWESQVQQLSMGMMQPTMPQYADYEIRAIKRGHLHHVETVIVRVKGYPNDFTIIVEEEHIGPIGRELINRRLFGTIDKQINDGLFDMQMPMGMQMGPQPGTIQPPMGQPTPQQSMPQTQIRCPQCGYMNPPGAKFCLNCGTKLM